MNSKSRTSGIALLCLATFSGLGYGFQESTVPNSEDEKLLVEQSAIQSRVASQPIFVGSRRELFVDSFLIDRLDGARLELHHPKPAESVIVFDKPWEGAFAGYATVIKDNDTYRMYYRGLPVAGADGTDVEVTCCAMSDDGIHWKKPELNNYQWQGSGRNNIVLMSETPASHNFAPFLDSNPAAPADQRYKALGGIETSGLIAFASPDGLQWRRIQDEPVFQKGIFDSQNVAFWSESEQQYVCYFRTWTGDGYSGFRTISRTTSPDFIHWSDPEEMEFGDTPREHLYTNQTVPYFRAPHIYLGLAARFMPGRRVITTADADRIGVVPRYSNDCSDTVLLSSRGGNVFDRSFMESFVRPGIGQENWVSRSNYAACGIVPTGEQEVSVYLSRNYGQPTAYLQRYTLRMDGFVSVNAGYQGGEMITRVLKFPELSLKQSRAKEQHWREQVATADRWPELESKQPIVGSRSLKIEGPFAFKLPGTRQLGRAFTLAAHVRGVPRGHRRLFSAYNGGGTAPNELLLDFNSGGGLEGGSSLRFLFNDGAVEASHETLGDWSLESGDERPHHLAVTWCDGLTKLYFDGRLVAEKQLEDPGEIKLEMGDLQFGEDYPPTSTENEPFLGLADELVVTKRCLSEVEISQLARCGFNSLGNGALYLGVALDFEKDTMSTDGVMSLSFSNKIGVNPNCHPMWAFVGRQLTVNVASSAAGSIRVEIQKPDGTAYPGFTLAECDEIVGDQLDRAVSWGGRSDVSSLANEPIRLRFVMKDADLYSMQFN